MDTSETQNCYIRVVNGKAFEHPFLESNLKEVVRNFDPENPPAGLEKFVRTPFPMIGFLEVYEGTTYEKIDGVWQDVHKVRPLTEDEKAAKIQFAKDTFIYSDTWELDEVTGQWIPPVPYPNDGLTYGWDEDKTEWVFIEPNFKPSS